MNSQKFIAPLSFIGAMFFVCGFALGVNPLLVPVLRQTLDVSSFESYMVVFASFVPFLLWGYPAQEMIAKVGYKKTMAFSFVLFALSFGGYVVAAIYSSFSLFLLSSFASGTANAFLQAAINPYVTFLGPIDSAAKRISMMGICNKLAWPLPSLFIVWIVGKEVNSLEVGDLYTPFYILIGIVAVLALVCLCFPLPAMSNDGHLQSESESAPQVEDASGKTSIFQFPHLWLGCLALFLYVGVETVSLSTSVDYAVNLGLENSKMYAWIAPIGMIIGYISGVLLIPKYLSQASALTLCSAIAIVGAVMVPLMPASISIYFIFLLALGCSLMWPALWPLAIDGLGKFSKAGASLLTMSIAGGAVIPTLFGLLNDANRARLISDGMDPLGCNQSSYWICLPCFLFIFYYGIWGWKIGRKNYTTA